MRNEALAQPRGSWHQAGHLQSLPLCGRRRLGWTEGVVMGHGGVSFPHGRRAATRPHRREGCVRGLLRRGPLEQADCKGYISRESTRSGQGAAAPYLRPGPHACLGSRWLDPSRRTGQALSWRKITPGQAECKTRVCSSSSDVGARRGRCQGVMGSSGSRTDGPAAAVGADWRRNKERTADNLFAVPVPSSERWPLEVAFWGARQGPIAPLQLPQVHPRRACWRSIVVPCRMELHPGWREAPLALLIGR